MIPQKTNENFDILNLEIKEENNGISSMILDLEKDLENLNLSNEINESISLDNENEVIFQINENDFLNEFEKINSSRKNSHLKKLFKNFDFVWKIKFLSYYLLVSSFVFFILLGISNYSAYSKIIYSYINPQSLKDSSQDILNTIDNSKIKVYADEWIDEQLENNLKKKIEEDEKLTKQTSFSPKKLVPRDSSIDLDLEITPYENRIIIPKIWKNIPLVDVDSRRWLTYENLQDIFMSELEKWVVRYPWTALPWETWNMFIFWHSSNYPWIKWEYNDVFVLLDNLVYGDEITVYYGQKKYVYVITEKKVIKPGDVDVLNRPEWKKELSLMTCWPIWTVLNRLIVFVELKETKELKTNNQ